MSRFHGASRVVLAVLAAISAVAAPAAAQAPVVERAYVTVGLFGDVKRFSGDPTESTLDGQADDCKLLRISANGKVLLAVHNTRLALWDLERRVLIAEKASRAWPGVQG